MGADENPRNALMDIVTHNILLTDSGSWYSVRDVIFSGSTNHNQYRTGVEIQNAGVNYDFTSTPNIELGYGTSITDTPTVYGEFIVLGSEKIGDYNTDVYCFVRCSDTNSSSVIFKEIENKQI